MEQKWVSEISVKQTEDSLNAAAEYVHVIHRAEYNFWASVDEWDRDERYRKLLAPNDPVMQKQSLRKFFGRVQVPLRRENAQTTKEPRSRLLLIIAWIRRMI